MRAHQPRQERVEPLLQPLLLQRRLLAQRAERALGRRLWGLRHGDSRQHDRERQCDGGGDLMGAHLTRRRTKTSSRAPGRACAAYAEGRKARSPAVESWPTNPPSLTQEVGASRCGWEYRRSDGSSPSRPSSRRSRWAATRPDFVREVQPILAASCVRCHGQDESKALLRLDSEASFRLGGESGAVVVPGDPATSVLYARITNPDPKQRMPQEAAALQPAQVETLRRWIEARGALGRGCQDRGPGGSRGDASASPRGARAQREPPRLQPRRAADPGRELLSLPRPRQEQPQGGAAPRPRGSGQGDARLGHGSDRGRRAGSQRRAGPRPSPGRSTAHAAREERPGAVAARAGRDAAALDRGGRGVGAALGLHPARAARASDPARRSLGEEPDRRLRPRRNRGGWASPDARGPSRGAAAPAELRSHRPAAVARGGAQRSCATRDRTPTSGRWTACSPRPTTASGWRSSGSTSCATPTAWATTATTRGRCGAIATGSSPPSTATCRSTASRPSSSRATCCPTPATSSGSPPATTACCRRARRAARSRRSTARSTSPTACATPRACGWARPSAARSATTTSSTRT